MSATPTLGQRLSSAGRAFFAALPPPPAGTWHPRDAPRALAVPRLRGGFAQRAAMSAPVTSSNDPASIGQLATALAGGRVTLEHPDLYTHPQSYWLPPASPEEEWAALKLDERAIGSYPPWKLLELLADLSPDVSRAAWETNRMLCGEWSVACYQIGTTTPHEVALARTRAFIDRLTERHGAFEIVVTRLFTNAYFRGAIFGELVLDRAGKLAIDLATPDPISVRFREVRDAETGGTRFQLGQLQRGVFTTIERPTVRYLPLDPLPGVPYGRSPFAPAIYPAMFVLAMLHDIRRVVAQQGWPRLDISIDFDAMLAAMPPEAAGDTAELARWCQAHIDDVVAVYSDLPPDAAYVHASTISVNQPVGAVDSDSLGGINGLIAALERFLVRALKMMPLVMGITDGVSEANANRQWEILLTSLRHPQRLVATLLERFFSLALRAEGIQARVDFTFQENRKSEEQRDEQVKELKIRNATAAYKAGFIDQDEAAQWAVGHDAAEQEPRPPALAPGAPGTPGGDQVTTDGGNKDATPPKGESQGGKARALPLREVA